MPRSVNGEARRLGTDFQIRKNLFGSSKPGPTTLIASYRASCRILSTLLEPDFKGKRKRDYAQLQKGPAPTMQLTGFTSTKEGM